MSFAPSLLVLCELCMKLHKNSLGVPTPEKGVGHCQNITRLMAKELSMDEKVELFNQLVAAHPDAVRKGATIPYTSLNGHMYSYLSKDGVVALRLPEAMRQPFLDKYKTTLMSAYGIVQKEYVTVPDSLLRKTGELQPYFNESYKYVGSLKPKPTARKKSSG